MNEQLYLLLIWDLVFLGQIVLVLIRLFFKVSIDIFHNVTSLAYAIVSNQELNRKSDLENLNIDLITSTPASHGILTQVVNDVCGELLNIFCTNNFSFMILTIISIGSD